MYSATYGRPLLVAACLVFVMADSTAQTAPRVAGPPVALTRAEDGPFTHPRWSPDGSRLAFTSVGFAGLWVVDAPGTTGASDPRPITDAPSAGFGYSWSPDGSSLLTRISNDETGRRRHAVRLFDATNGGTTELAPFRPSIASLPEFAAGTPDVALVAGGEVETFRTGLPEAAAKTGRADRIFLLDDGRPVLADAFTGSTRQLDLFAGETLINAATSPDGRRVVFEVVGSNVFVIDLDDETTEPVDIGRGNRPQWSPEGEWIVYMRTDDDGERFTSSDLVAVRIDGRAELRLTDTPDRLEMNPSWSPDGTRLAYDDLADGIVYLLPISR